MVRGWFQVNGKAVNSLVPVGLATLDVVVVEVLILVDVDEVKAGHEELPPAIYLKTSL